MNEKVIVLGSDFGTIDVVKEAQKTGFYVIVTDLMENSPTKDLADETWMISTTDIDLLAKRCIEENVIAVMTGASDFNITNARMLCKKLNLPIYCDSDYAWKVARDKSEFKKICKEVGVPVAKDYYVSENLTDEELDKIKFPVVVKPVDNSGNKGVSYCSNKEELRKAYKYARSVSDNNTIIIERRLHGPQWAVNYVIADGEVSFLYSTREHYQPGELPNIYSLMSISSYKLKQFLEQIDGKIKQLFKKAEFKDGLAWVQTILDEDGFFYLIECGYRYGGEMSYGLYEKVCGFNTIKWMQDIALGIKHTQQDLPKILDKAYKSTTSTYFLFSTKDSIIHDIKGIDKLEKLPNVVIDMPKRIGSNVKYHSCMGTIRIYGETCDEMLEIVKKINSILEIKDIEGDNLFIHFTDYDSVKNEFEMGLREFDI